MKYIAYSLISLVAFWAGAVWMEARKPYAPVYITKSAPPPYKPENCMEVARQCVQKKRAEKTRL